MPNWGLDFDWVADDLFAREYQGLMRSSSGDVVVYRNVDLAALRAHPNVSHQTLDALTSLFHEPGETLEPGFARFQHANTFSMRPPVHPPAKQLTARQMTAKNIARFQEDFAEVARSLIDAAVARGEIDFVHDFARPAIAGFWSRTLGLTIEEAEHALKVATDLQRAALMNPDAEAVKIANRAGDEWMDMMTALLERGLRRGEHPMLLELASDHDAMEPLGRPENSCAHFGSALLDGFHTLGAIIAGVVYAMLKGNVQPRALPTDGSPATNVFHEGSRLHPAVTFTLRQAAEDFVYDGTLIARDANVAMMWLFGNRDPDVFADPNAYVLERPNRSKQYTFGGGFYICPGRNIVKMLCETIIEEFVRSSVEARGDRRGHLGSRQHAARVGSAARRDSSDLKRQRRQWLPAPPLLARDEARLPHFDPVCRTRADPAPRRGSGLFLEEPSANTTPRRLRRTASNSRPRTPRSVSRTSICASSAPPIQPRRARLQAACRLGPPRPHGSRGEFLTFYQVSR